MSRPTARDWTFDPRGMLPAARFVASPNFDERPPGEQLTLLVVHSISLPPGRFSGDAVARLFGNRLDASVHPYFAGLVGLKVSAHFFIRRRGELIQFVPVSKRAWHAGASVWKGRERCNDYSVGIELEGCDDRAFTDPQYRRLARLTRALQSAYPIADIVGHADIAPGRKTDPGPCFDWVRYRALLAGAAQSQGAR
ncbi:MAG: 1,6-anhydro-N-acetylmuramyl-L-alanine amidase AmpD [Betaproteobacteria bacterium]|nr:1,6-anhydro-N-acetylmuramyl-L-alanine amidase AmpD [Betaproteobacteria bacterium]